MSELDREGEDGSQALNKDHPREGMHDVGRGIMLGNETDDEAQRKEAERAMEKGDEAAKMKVAFFKLSGLGGAKVDADGAVALLEDRAKEEDCEAKWMLGLCCEHGMGTEQDIERAVVLYEESWEGGNVVGEFLMRNGKGGRGSGVMKVNSL